MTVRVSPMAAVSLAETRARSKLGMAIAAMIPMIATTINSSIRVKPCCLRIDIPLSLPLVSDSERSGEMTRGDAYVPPCPLRQGYRSAGQDATVRMPAAQQLVLETFVTPTTPLESPPKARTPVVPEVIGDA